jgi:ketosteroid isomerase-like protein
MNEHLAVVKAYLALSEALETDPAAYAAVFHPEVEQIEYPNLLTKTTQHRSLEAILDNVRAGRELLQAPQFEQTHLQLGADGNVILETAWHAIIMDDFGPMVRGGRLSAHFSMVFTFKDGLIFRQRTYRCYDPLTE